MPSWPRHSEGFNGLLYAQVLKPSINSPKAAHGLFTTTALRALCTVPTARCLRTHRYTPPTYRTLRLHALLPGSSVILITGMTFTGDLVVVVVIHCS